MFPSLVVRERGVPRHTMFGLPGQSGHAVPVYVGRIWVISRLGDGPRMGRVGALQQTFEAPLVFGSSVPIAVVSLLSYIVYIVALRVARAIHQSHQIVRTTLPNGRSSIR
jgi:hypothetical protein